LFGVLKIANVDTRIEESLPDDVRPWVIFDDVAPGEVAEAHAVRERGGGRRRGGDGERDPVELVTARYRNLYASDRPLGATGG
jgi:hypothetical protein